MAANSSNFKAAWCSEGQKYLFNYILKKDVIEMNSRSLVWVLNIFLHASQGNLWHVSPNFPHVNI